MSRAPIAYYVCGGLELHGDHTVLGIDGIAPYEMALAAANRIGGIVLPPFFLGCPCKPLKLENEPEATVPEPRRPDCWYEPALMDQLTAATFENLSQIGFKVCMVVPGHGPNASVIRGCCERMHYQCGAMRIGFVYYGNLWGKWPKPEDCGHGGVLESATLKHLRPDLVNVDKLLSEGPRMRRVHMPISGPAAVSDEVGRSISDLVIMEIVEQAKRLLHQQRPSGHGE